MKNNYQYFIILKLRKLREEHGYSQMDIATILGISPGQMGNIESAKAPNKYTLHQIYTLCHKFGVPIEQIFIEDNEYGSTNFTDLLISKIIKYG